MPLLTKTNIELMINGIKLLEPRVKGLYNPLYKEQTIKTYFGDNRCGEACFILKYLLEEMDYKVNIYKIENKMHALYNDHVFIKIDNIIIDPTYKQFLQSIYSRNSECRYVNTMQLDLSPIFIGDKEDLLQIITKLNSLHTNIYNKDLNIYDYWQDASKYEFNIDLSKCMNEKKYLLKQDKFYKQFTSQFKKLLE